MKKTIIKGATLALFVSLVGSFVLYRGGFFGSGSSSYWMSPNGSVINSSPNENEPTTDSISRQPMIISSSKVMIIKDPMLQVKDSVKTDSNLSVRNKDRIISSSKSLQVFDRKDFEQSEQDSLQLDSTKNYRND